MGTQNLLRAASGKGRWGGREQSSALIPWHWLNDLAGVVIAQKRFVVTGNDKGLKRPH